MTQLAEILLRASKDEHLRRRLIDDPVTLASEFSLSEGDINALSRLSVDPYGHSPSGLRALARMLVGYDQLGFPIVSRDPV